MKKLTKKKVEKQNATKYSWESDYFLLPTKKEMLVDEYLQLGDAFFNQQEYVASYLYLVLFFLHFSDSVRFGDIFRCCFSIGAPVRLVEQSHRNPFGCRAIRTHLSKNNRKTSDRYRCLEQYPNASHVLQYNDQRKINEKQKMTDDFRVPFCF